MSPDGRTAYVSDQGSDTVTVLDIAAATPQVTGEITVGTHPNRMAVDARTGTLYVANSESDSVSVINAGASKPDQTISLAPYQGAPVGANPDALALTPDGHTLYAVNSGDNDVDVIDAGSGKVRFVTLDNFYADAEVSAQGWNWSVGANSNPYVEQTWVGNYSGRNHPYDYEGGNDATAMNTNPLDSYIWDRLADAGIRFRNYGFYETGNQLNTGANGADPRLAANTDPNFYGWDLMPPPQHHMIAP